MTGRPRFAAGLAVRGSPTRRHRRATRPGRRPGVAPPMAGRSTTADARPPNGHRRRARTRHRGDRHDHRPGGQQGRRARSARSTIDPAEFGGKINQQLLHDVVLMYLANQRAGTHQHAPPRRGGRQHEEAVPPEGHRQRPRRHQADEQAARRRYGEGPEAPRLRVPPAEEGRPGRHPHGDPVASSRQAKRSSSTSLAFAAPKTKEMAGVLKAIKIGKKTDGDERREGRDAARHDGADRHRRSSTRTCTSRPATSTA